MCIRLYEILNGIIVNEQDVYACNYIIELGPVWGNSNKKYLKALVFERLHRTRNKLKTRRRIFLLEKLKPDSQHLFEQDVFVCIATVYQGTEVLFLCKCMHIFV